jgi:hypothetical protein
VAQSEIEPIRRAIENMAGASHGLERDEAMLEAFAALLGALTAQQREIDTLLRQAGLQSPRPGLIAASFGRLSRSLGWS